MAMFKCQLMLLILVVATEQYFIGDSDPLHYPDCASVGSGFTDVGGSCYKVMLSHKSFDDARALCRAQHPNADLATIRCDRENEGVYGLAKSGGISRTCQNYYNSHIDEGQISLRSQMWIGLSDPNSASNSFWVNGADAVYRYWAPGEPNNKGGLETGTMMYLFSFEGQTVPHWNDHDPSTVLCAAACEVLTAKSGNACGLEPCRITTTAMASIPSSCVHYHPPNCAAVANGFSNVGGSCYRVIEAHANFSDARGLCKKLHPDADLATIRCEQENQGVYELSRGDLLLACESYYIHNQFDPASYYRSQMWIGLNDPNSVTHGSWVNGAKASFRKWSQDPNNSRNESGMATYMNLFEWYHTQWHNIDPSTVMCAAVCEVITRETGTSC